ncbi:PspC domain-containing protein [Actinomycetaceae bacterium L2_0104]
MEEKVLPERYPLRRPTSGRIMLGVCQGIADHLGVPVKGVRLIFIASAFLFGSGIFLYLWLAISMTSSNERPASEKLAPAPRRKLGKRQRLLLYAVAALVAALIVVIVSLLDLPWGTILAVVCMIAGAGLAWSNFAGDLPAREALIRLGGGIGLLVIGVLALVVRDQPLTRVVSSVLLGVGVLAVAGLALWPVIQRLLRDLQNAREESAREAERADMAAHLHDSVLQTLTLIRNQANDPEAVQRLARVQERQLRSWLYSDPKEEVVSLSEAIKATAEEVEDLYGVGLETVVVGEGKLDQNSPMLLAAMKEALANGVRHGKPPVSVYAEISDGSIDVFVRDHGDGFEVDEIPEDRHGVRDSIIERIERHGGTAVFRRRDPGTEVHLNMGLGMA